MVKKNTESNKLLSAGFGAAATFQSAIEDGFQRLVAKGEVARNNYRTSINKYRTSVRKDVTKQVKQAKKRVVSTYDTKSPIKIDDAIGRVGKACNTITERTFNLLNMPTSKDFAAINKKLDKVIKKIAA